MEGWLTDARATPGQSERAALYARVAGQVLTDRPYLWLWHRRNATGYANRVGGFTAYPDGVIRWAGVTLQER